MCNICTEDYNKLRIRITCPVDECSYECCRYCLREYLLGKSETAHCPDCIREYPRTFAVVSLGKSWYGTAYKVSRRNAILARELLLLPEAAQHIAPFRERVDATAAEATARQAVRDALAALRTVRLSYGEARYRRISAMHAVPKDDAPPFRHPCPADGCQGFVSSQWKCGVCEMWSCSKCREMVGADKTMPHECDPNTLASVELIKTSSRPCPKCKVPVEHTSGCRQMYCTQCGCWWDYNTGQIDKGTFRHNPHYFAMIDAGTAPLEANDPDGEECTLGTLTPTRLRRLQHTLLSNISRHIFDTYRRRVQIATRIERAEHLREVLGTETAEKVMELYRHTIDWDISDDEIASRFQIRRPLRRFGLIVATTFRTEQAIQELRDTFVGSDRTKQLAIDNRVRHMVGQLGKDKLAAAAWQRETSSDMAHDQHDVLIAVQDVLGAAFVKMQSAFNSVLTPFVSTESVEERVPEILDELLAQFRLVQSAFNYVNECTNEVKKTYSRAAYCFDTSRPQLLRQKALMSTTESTSECTSEITP
jgi:hypothetical protein